MVIEQDQDWAARRKTQQEYRELINKMGKKEFTLLKMQEYGFWPKDLPTPFERQLDETPEQFSSRQALMEKYKKLIEEIGKLYQKKDEINTALRELSKQYDETWDIEKIREDVARQIFKESIQRRTERKQQREIKRQQRAEAWQAKKAQEIVFVGRGYSSFLYHQETNETNLKVNSLPIIRNEHELASMLELEYKELRFLTYHRDVVTVDHYTRFTIPKRDGKKRLIAAPKKKLKHAQRVILDEILTKIPVTEECHGFVSSRSVVTNARPHATTPGLVLNMDLENFFPTITFQRVRGLFHSFGYSGQISTLLAMICTYCERIPIEVKGRTKYVATTPRILPQGSPASPMITNLACRRLDKRLRGLAGKFGYVYSRYADDLSFSHSETHPPDLGKFRGLVTKIIQSEGLRINHQKTRYLRPNNRQSVTGVVVNQKDLGVPRPWLRKFRAALHNARAIKASGGLPPEKVAEIRGMAAWIRSVNPTRYAKYLKEAGEILKQ